MCGGGKGDRELCLLLSDFRLLIFLSYIIAIKQSANKRLFRALTRFVLFFVAASHTHSVFILLFFSDRSRS